jgi:DNA modification methylase
MRPQHHNGSAARESRNGSPATRSTKAVERRNQLNDLSATEWIGETVSVWTQRGLGASHPDAQIERKHPAPFSFTDVSRLIRFFTKKGEAVLDPFAGVGSTLKACAIEGRKGIGFELNQKYVALTRDRLRKEIKGTTSVNQKIRKGDARVLARRLPSDSIDFVVTSPPYWNILHKEDHKAKQERKARNLDTRYGNDKRDLGNIREYSEFVQQLSMILGDCARALKPRKYLAIIVSDFRDKSRFVMFHADLAAALEQYQLQLRGMTVLYQRHKRVFPYGYPFAYVPNIHHQFILILQNAKTRMEKRC